MRPETKTPRGAAQLHTARGDWCPQDSGSARQHEPTSGDKGGSAASLAGGNPEQRHRRCLRFRRVRLIPRGAAGEGERRCGAALPNPAAAHGVPTANVGQPKRGARSWTTRFNIVVCSGERYREHDAVSIPLSVHE